MSVCFGGGTYAYVLVHACMLFFKTEFYVNLFQALIFIYCVYIYIYFEEWI